MKLVFAVLLFAACITTPERNPYAYEEQTQCPGRSMTAEEHASGVVRCRAMCSSYARDFDNYSAATCKCFCKPERGAKKAPITNQM